MWYVYSMGGGEESFLTLNTVVPFFPSTGVPLQDFVVRNDSPCGSTIGPIMSARLGMATIDIGAPQLSMHSIREMGCTSSIAQCIGLYESFFKNYPTVFKNLSL